MATPNPPTASVPIGLQALPPSIRASIFWPFLIRAAPLKVALSAVVSYVFTGMFPWEADDVSELLRGYAVGGLVMYGQLSFASTDQEVRLLVAQYF